MKLGIIADTHENMPKIKEAVGVFNRTGVVMVVHAGDFISPITADPFSELEAPMLGVFGNNDGDRLFLTERFKGIAKLVPDYYQFDLDGRSGVLMHQPKFIDALVEAGTYDLVVYGHTHEIDIRDGDPVVVNPGECCGWLTQRSTVAVLDTEDMSVELIDV